MSRKQTRCHIVGAVSWTGLAGQRIERSHLQIVSGPRLPGWPVIRRGYQFGARSALVSKRAHLTAADPAGAAPTSPEPPAASGCHVWVIYRP